MPCPGAGQQRIFVGETTPKRLAKVGKRGVYLFFGFKKH
jgi:hypothetical protein